MVCPLNASSAEVLFHSCPVALDSLRGTHLSGVLVLGVFVAPSSMGWAGPRLGRRYSWFSCITSALAFSLHLLPSVSCHICFGQSGGIAGQQPCGVSSYVLLLSSFEILICERLRSPADVCLSEEYKPVRPVIVSPANETMEAGLGKWVPITLCWNHYFELKIKINSPFTAHNRNHLLNRSRISEKVAQIMSLNVPLDFLPLLAEI